MLGLFAQHRTGEGQRVESAMIVSNLYLNDLQPRLADVALPALAMRADRKAMRLIAQPFDEIKHGIARLEFERVTPGQEKSLHTRVPIRALSDGN